ncbi:MAG: hypothetical protein WDN04_13770 [Rhodospirillales bacterium]
MAKVAGDDEPAVASGTAAEAAGDAANDPLGDIADRGELKVGRNLAETFRRWKDEATRDLLGTGTTHSLLHTVSTDLERATRPLLDVAREGGAVPPAGLPPATGGGDDQNPYGIGFSLKDRSPAAEMYLREVRQNKIAELTKEQQVLIRDILLDAVSRGASPDDMARRIRQNIGLTSTQAQHVDNYRTELEQAPPDPRALNRKLRDKRYDGVISRAIDEGRPLTVEEINRYVDAYHRKYLAFRAMTIARTESVVLPTTATWRASGSSWKTTRNSR